ncbi:MAG: DinB family protein [Gemmatimonadetes bacterium]|nr:DinB family protein [Gemmatimonadota bacterium]
MSTPADTLTLRQAAFGDLETELATTRRVLERVPDEHFAWKPHDKSFSLGSLASHVANLPLWGTATAQSDELDLGTNPPKLEAATDNAALLRLFDANTAELREALGALPEEAFARDWTLRMGEKVMMKRPKASIIRGMVINHMVHHRGALSVYLRLLDVPVPSIYGPSADEQATF